MTDPQVTEADVLIAETILQSVRGFGVKIKASHSVAVAVAAIRVSAQERVAGEVKRLETREKELHGQLDRMIDRWEKITAAAMPFGKCVEQISEDEPNDEWAKFRLLVGDYRRLAEALNLTVDQTDNSG